MPNFLQRRLTMLGVDDKALQVGPEFSEFLLVVLVPRMFLLTLNSRFLDGT